MQHWTEVLFNGRRCFREGRVSIEDNTWSGHSITAINNISIAIVATILDEDQRVMVTEIETETEILRTTVHHILTEHFCSRKQWLCGGHQIH